MKKRLLIVMGSMGFGGAERVISHIANDFSRRGWEVKIAMILDGNVDYELGENVEALNLSGGIGPYICRLPLWLFRLRRLARQFKPDYMLSFFARVNIVAQIACMGLGIPTVVSERNDPYMDGRSRAVDFLTGLTYPHAKAVVFQTRRAAGYFEKNGLSNNVIIPNPITVYAQRKPMVPGKIVTMGRLVPQKNHKMLIEVFSRIHKDFPETQLTIYGNGSGLAETEVCIRENEVEDCVFLPGSVTDVHEQISDANLFVLSSDYEGLSNALLEAMMLGIPCISTDCAGSDEYIEDGVNGFLTPVGAPDAMEKAIRKLLQEPALAEEMAKCGMQTVANLEKSRILERWYHTIAE